ncbi:LysR family transcriptional regulator [Bosea sp. CCNWLW174]|uniref:LysR family transcriptional regulator n=1 Tax=unclassified Bosea (in: a-proteobacteria) TaxID=2653178 RepID=UPI003014F8AF
MNDLKCLETFVWVARLGGFRAAAAQLNTTQPSISARIDQLEQHFGVTLFGPPLKRSTLTREGTVLLEYAERILATMTEARTVVSRADAVRGVLRLGVAETLVHSLMPRLIEVINTSYPDLVVDMIVDTTNVLTEHLLRGQIDVGMQVGPVADPRAVNQRLCHLPLGWVASPELPLGDEPLTLARLAQWPIISFSHGSPLAEEIKRALGGEGREQVRLWGSASLTIMTRMALDGMGSCILPLALVREDLACGRLRRLSVEGVTLPPNGFQISYLRKSNNFLAALVARHACQIGRVLEHEARPDQESRSARSKNTIRHRAPDRLEFQP